jgi:hypothetical protein
MMNPFIAIGGGRGGVAGRARRGLQCLALATAFVSCGSPTDSTPRDFSGRWIVTESGSIAQADLTCNGLGVLQLSQEGSEVTGDYDMRGQCTLGSQATDTPRFGPITGAQVEGTELTFEHDRCTYTGHGERESADRLAGKLRCTYRIDGSDLSYVGTWSAVRVPPPVTVVNTP